MSLRRRNTEKQQELWVTTESVAKAPGHVFYERLNRQCLTQLGWGGEECSFFRYVEPDTGAVLYLRNDQNSAFVFDAGHDHAGVSCSVNRVTFPVAEAAA